MNIDDMQIRPSSHFIWLSRTLEGGGDHPWELIYSTCTLHQVLCVITLLIIKITISLNLISPIKPLYFILIHLETCKRIVCNRAV